MVMSTKTRSRWLPAAFACAAVLLACAWTAAVSARAMAGAAAQTGKTAKPAKAGPAAPARRSTWTGVYTEQQARRGRALYDERCAYCHGDDLFGGDCAAPLIGPAFHLKWN